MPKHEVRGSESGFSLIELMVAMSIFGVLTALAVMPLRGYQHSQEHVGAAREVVAALRNAQVRAVNEGSTYRAEIKPHAVRVFSGSTLVKTYSIPSHVKLDVFGAGFTPAASPSDPTPAPVKDAYFYGRGTGSAGVIRVTRTSSTTKSYTITIEGLTARVSLS